MSSIFTGAVKRPIGLTVRRSGRSDAGRWRLMSVIPANCIPPSSSDTPSRPSRSRPRTTTLQSLYAQKLRSDPISMITAYDYPTSLSLSSSASPVDIILVGDSLAQTCLGLPSTIPLTLDVMIHHAQACARGREKGSNKPLLIADMPFGSYGIEEGESVRNAMRLMKEAGVDGVKMEGGEELSSTITAMTRIGIPVLAHVGLMPQRYLALSGYKVQGRTKEGLRKVLDDAKAVEKSGAFGTVIECVGKEVGRYVTQNVNIPTIGIGAGPWTDGQVLVYDDMMSTFPPHTTHKAKFVRSFANVHNVREHAIEEYIRTVKARTFPDEVKESYSMEKGEWEAFVEVREEEER